MRSILPKERPPALPRQMGNAFFKGVHVTADNLLWGAPLIALEAASAQRGEQLPTLTGRVAGLIAQPAIAGILSSGTVAAIGCPPAAAAIAGSMFAAYVSTKLEDPAIQGIKWLSRKANQGRRVAFGGDFEDTQTDRARRQRALQDIAGGMTPARQWLGQEARILHR